MGGQQMGGCGGPRGPRQTPKGGPHTSRGPLWRPFWVPRRPVENHGFTAWMGTFGPVERALERPMGPRERRRTDQRGKKTTEYKNGGRRKQKQREECETKSAGHWAWPSPGPIYMFYYNKTTCFANPTWAPRRAPGGVWGAHRGALGGPWGALRGADGVSRGSLGG